MFGLHMKPLKTKAFSQIRMKQCGLQLLRHSRDQLSSPPVDLVIGVIITSASANSMRPPNHTSGASCSFELCHSVHKNAIYFPPTKWMSKIIMRIQQQCIMTKHQVMMQSAVTINVLCERAFFHFKCVFLTR